MNYPKSLPRNHGPLSHFTKLDDVLPAGSGYCLDIGCGHAPHRRFIEEAGYTWIGLDLRSYDEPILCGNAQKLAFADESISAVVCWQALEHFPQPWVAVQEMARVLKPGGVIFGSTSFLEPFHDWSYFGFSQEGISTLLSDAGLSDIEVRPGISCFPLITWTLFSRMAGGRLAGAAFQASAMFVDLLNLAYPLLRRMFLLGEASDSLAVSYWVSQAPLEFAGHIVFTGHKPTT